MSYSKTSTVKILRTKHKIGFAIGETVGSLLESINKVPPDATIDEIIIDDSGGIITIEFHEECREEPT